MDENKEETPKANPAEEARKKLEEILGQKIDADEAALTLAEIDVQRQQVKAYIMSLKSRIIDAESQLTELDCSESIIKRRLLNK